MGLLSSVFKKINIEEKESYTLAEKRAITDVVLATVALSTYAAAVDGEVSIYEYMESDINVATLNKQYHLSDDLSHTVDALSMKHSITWDEVKDYLDALTPDTLASLKAAMDNVVNASDGVNEEESKVLSQFNEYIESRA